VPIVSPAPYSFSFDFELTVKAIRLTGSNLQLAYAHWSYEEYSKLLLTDLAKVAIKQFGLQTAYSDDHVFVGWRSSSSIRNRRYLVGN
jgi:hypothetical protein